MHIHIHMHTLPLPQPSFSMLKSTGTYSSYSFTSVLSTLIWDHLFLLKLSGWLQMAIKNSPRWHSNLSHGIFSIVALSGYTVCKVSLFWKLRHLKILTNFLIVWSYFNCSAFKLYFINCRTRVLFSRREVNAKMFLYLLFSCLPTPDCSPAPFSFQ